MSAENPTLARRYINGAPEVGQEEAYNSVCDLEAEVESWAETNKEASRLHIKMHNRIVELEKALKQIADLPISGYSETYRIASDALENR